MADPTSCGACGSTLIRHDMALGWCCADCGATDMDEHYIEGPFPGRSQHVEMGTRHIQRGPEVVPLSALPIVMTPSGLVKLASIAAHVAEALTPDGHASDLGVVHALLGDPEVVLIMGQLDQLALLPVRR